MTWWDLEGGRWVKAGSAAARFGAKGLVEGASRKQNTDTTPTGLYDLTASSRCGGAARASSRTSTGVGRRPWVSVPSSAMRAILAWAAPGRKPHIAIGTAGGSTAITRY